ncbi:hypothetical protein VSS37_17450 [Candidatus Thiothrix sp. Deng01]|uniref:ASCH domain-containing protein n=1 Tax=Candidatus Thiothrix phosphatis TaxID=3112415 RepID=A0ABU6D140_9GAMM|nr:hypothetical protein [Candidatus Thiothrix sp. Deng01]MEB4592771.1 hypothetical protein [Candidatus Thiothrix sp. Deng01]
MKNYVIIGHLWLRAIEFVNEERADAYITKNCNPETECGKYTQEEFYTEFQEFYLESHEYGVNEYGALRLIIIREP